MPATAPTAPPARHALPPGHQLTHVSKPAADLRPGDAIHLAGLGTFAVTHPPAPLPRGELLIRLGWERLALTVATHAHFDTTTANPPLIWRHRPCPTCAGTGRGR